MTGGGVKGRSGVRKELAENLRGKSVNFPFNFPHIEIYVLNLNEFL